MKHTPGKSASRPAPAAGKTKIPERPSPPRLAVVAGDPLLRLPQVREQIPLSRATIYRKIAEGKFPSGFKLGPNSRAWRQSSIDRYKAEREAAAQ